MAIKNLLLAYTGSESADAALDAAVLMHEKYGAHVTGLLAHDSRLERLSLETWVPESVRKTLDGLEGERHGAVKARFFARASGRIADGQVHWISRHGDGDATVAEYARMFDLTIVGRRDAVGDRRQQELHPDRIAVKSGRPVLLVPRDWYPRKIVEHAVLAWDGRRAATRALADAMQILETKQMVTILTIEDGRTAPPLPGIDVATALARHGVDTRTVREPLKGRSAAEAILDVCAGAGAGLLVMGAYEHSVFREEILGGTTRHIAEKATLPILMSH